MLTVLIISLIVAGILFAAYYYFCAGKLSAVNDEIERILKAGDVAAALEKSERLKPAWKAFENSLTRTNDKVFSTADAAEFFSVATLTQGLNMTFWQSYGGIFTGLGILGTFAGLTYGLYDVDMTSGDIEVLKSGIANLLSGVQTAFVTSLAGILAGIVYSFAHHFLLKNFQENIQRLTDKLDEIYPRRNVEDWLAENNRDIRDQTVSLKNLGESVGQMLSDGFDEKISELSDNICAAIEKLGNSSTEGLDETLIKIAGTQMARFSAALDRFSDSIDEKLKAAAEISKTMNEQLLKTLQELTAKLKENAQEATEQRDADYEKFSSMLEGLIKLLNNTAAGNTAQINEAVKAFREIVDRHNATTKETFDRIQDLLGDTVSLLESMEKASTTFRTAADPVKQSTLQLTQNLTATSAQMNRLAEINQTNLDNLAALSTRLATFVQNFNGIANELERATNTIKDSLDNYNAKTSKELSDALTKFDKSVNGAYSGLDDIVGDLIDALDEFNEKRR